MRLNSVVFIALALLSSAVAPELPAGPQAAKQKTAKLMNPLRLTEKAPDKFQAKFDTSKGVFVIEVTRDWAPHGADRFYNLVKNGYYDNCRFYRVVKDFMVQFGLNGDPKVTAVWATSTIKDDPVKQSNLRGYVTYAKSSAPNSRTTQVFINYTDRNSRLDADGFAPFGQVIEGMDVVDSLYAGYGDAAPKGKGPDQAQIRAKGNAFLTKEFPEMDHIKTATIVPAAK